MVRDYGSPLAIILALLASFGCHAPAYNKSAALADDAHPNINQFGRLVGAWYIEQEVRAEDGSWQSVSDAEWNFRYALGGYAIQDEWIQPPRSHDTAEDDSRQYGTNIRVYDAESDSWQVIWASNDQSTFTSYTAVANVEGNVVMQGSDPERPGIVQKITYYGIEEDSWQWKMEFSGDEVNWLEVARITAFRLE